MKTLRQFLTEENRNKVTYVTGTEYKVDVSEPEFSSNPDRAVYNILADRLGKAKFALTSLKKTGVTTRYPYDTIHVSGTYKLK